MNYNENYKKKALTECSISAVASYTLIFKFYGAWFPIPNHRFLALVGHDVQNQMVGFVHAVSSDVR